MLKNKLVKLQLNTYLQKKTLMKKLINFVKHCVSNNLNNCAYQISMNYKYIFKLRYGKKVSFL